MKTGCPYCSGRLSIRGYNDLATTNPEIAAEADGWDPTEVGPGNTKKRSWLCPVGHRYDAAVSSRARMGTGCPYCSGRKAIVGVNDLLTINPQLASQANGWDPTTVKHKSQQNKNFEGAGRDNFFHPNRGRNNFSYVG